jgi:hypothetical protein
MAESSLLLVFSNPTEGREAAFEEWYENTHIADVLQVPGVAAAQRYGMAPMATPELDDAPVPAAPAHRHLAVYELDGDADEVMAEFLRRVGSGEMALDDSLDLASISLAAWRPSGRRRQAEPAIKA